MQSTLHFIDAEQLASNDQTTHNDDAWYAQTDVIDQFLAKDDDFWALRIWLEKDREFCWSTCTKDSIRLLLLRAIKAIDTRINDQVNTILHHDSFQKMEASWRGLLYLTEQMSEFDNELSCKIKVLNLTWKELSRDIGRAIDFDQSDLFRLVYNNELNMPGGEPFGLLIGDYHVSHKPKPGIHYNDIDTLRGICNTAAAAFAPFVTGAAPSFFGVDHYADLANVNDIQAQFSQIEYRNWRSLRQMEDSRFLGLALPHVLMRAPYEQDGSRREGFYFKETIEDPKRDHLWGNAAYGFAAVALRAFTESGWFSQIRGLQPSQFKRGLVFNLPTTSYVTSRRTRLSKPSIDLQVGDRLEKQLSDSGFIPVSPVPYSEYLVFFSNASVNLPKHYDVLGAQVNARLSSMLQYILCVSRFAHYIKVMGREKVGAHSTADSIEREFQQWILQYTTATEDASDEVRSRYPLNEARIRVKEKAGQSGHYYSIIHLRPHFQLDQMVSSIRLITELSSQNN
ncbi:type VI secretion system contractile sheath large subunit [Photobacterium japonica]|uniref:type VI secretion system contractile sheath large subunit n=1 Tax=Photobacterium japonica TaxID=2910235 RepID=UPI003D0DDACC